MGVYVGMVAGLLGVVAIVAGVQGHGSALFTALTGQHTRGIGPASSPQPSGSAGTLQARPIGTVAGAQAPVIYT